MTLLHNVPIKRKITIVVLLTCVVALLVTGGSLFAFQVISFHQNFTRSLVALGEIIAKHATGAVAFKDKQAAGEMLSALKAKPHISHARIWLQDGTIFAEYGAAPESAQIKGPGAPPGLHSEGSYLVYRQPIVLDGEEVGLLVLRSNYQKEFQNLLRIYLLLLLGVLSGSILLALLLSTRLQRVISDPILNLAKMAQAVAQRKDYSVRAQKLEADEIGLLTDAFNQMLEQIQAQDGALRAAHQQKLESLVNSIDGIVWEADPSTLRFRFVSQQASRLLGYPVAQWLESAAFWEQHIHASDRKPTLEAFRLAVSALKPFAQEFRMTAAEGRDVWVRNNTTVIAEEGAPILLRGVMLDITERKRAEEKLEQLHKQLVTASRQAGMAEVATGVLHNVGNVLNSVNVSASLVFDRMRESKGTNLDKISDLLKAHRQDMTAFLTTDPKGKVLPSYLTSLAEVLKKERTEVLEELTLLNKNVQHIKDIVAMQQSYARLSGVTESLTVASLVDDAIQIVEAGFTRHSIQMLCDYAPAPPVAVDKHKVLQILINLLRNAKHSVQDSEQTDRRVSVSISQAATNRVQIRVTDNGLGIAPENLTKIFSHGFTTKKQGHGFGLHSGALAAKEMGGSLAAFSDGLGKGASFVLELPIAEGKSESGQCAASGNECAESGKPMSVVSSAKAA